MDQTQLAHALFCSSLILELSWGKWNQSSNLVTMRQRQSEFSRVWLWYSWATKSIPATAPFWIHSGRQMNTDFLEAMYHVVFFSIQYRSWTDIPSIVCRSFCEWTPFGWELIVWNARKHLCPQGEWAPLHASFTFFGSTRLCQTTLSPSHSLTICIASQLVLSCSLQCNWSNLRKADIVSESVSFSFFQLRSSPSLFSISWVSAGFSSPTSSSWSYDESKLFPVSFSPDYNIGDCDFSLLYSLRILLFLGGHALVNLLLWPASLLHTLCWGSIWRLPTLSLGILLS